MSARAGFEYDSQRFVEIVREHGLTMPELANSANMSERHLHNIANESVRFARAKTRKKLTNALERLGVPKPQGEMVFRPRGPNRI